MKVRNSISFSRFSHTKASGRRNGIHCGHSTSERQTLLSALFLIAFQTNSDTCRAGISHRLYSSDSFLIHVGISESDGDIDQA